MKRERSAGQAMAEFALVLPLFAAMVLGILDLGRAVWANSALANATREGARYAISHGGTATTKCPVGPPGPLTVIPAASTSCPYPSPSKEAIRDAARAFAISAGSTPVITVCYGVGCTGDVDATGATNVRGTPVTVKVTSTVTLVTGAIIGTGPMTMTHETTMTVSH